MSKKNTIYAIAQAPSKTHPTPTWALLVQPKKPTSKWFSSAISTKQTQTQTPTIYSSSGKTTTTTTVPDSTTLRILLGENDMPSITSKTDPILDAITISDPESWLGYAIAALQQGNLIDHFDIGTLTTLAHETLEQCPKDGKITVIDHEGRPIQKIDAAGTENGGVEAKERSRQQGKGGRGFWISYGPLASGSGARNRGYCARNSWERQDQAYGGLM